MCPHERAIPQGSCCTRVDMQIEPLVERLTEMPVGSDARIMFMSPTHHKKMDRLMALGMVPGTIVRLHQKKPAYVVIVGETTLAVDADILREIFVKPQRPTDPAVAS